MIDIARIDVRASLEQQIDNTTRGSEVERRLAVAASLVNAQRILSEHFLENVDLIEMRCRARIGNGARRNESIGFGRRRRVQGMESASPPTALLIWIRTGFEQRLDERDVTAPRDCDEGGRVELENGRVYRVAKLVVGLEQSPNGLRIAVANGFPELGNCELIHLRITFWWDISEN
jgi:hypothetical protein